MANPEVSDCNIFARKEHKSLFFPWKGKARGGEGGGGGGEGGGDVFSQCVLHCGNKSSEQEA